jgi:8-oxo-dGTP diphosphatase
VAAVPAGTPGAERPAPDAAWHPATDPPPVAFDHATILADGVERLRRDLWRGDAARGLVPEPFTLAELRRAYEAVLARPLDAPNFTRTVTARGLVEATADVAREGRRGRPGRRYRFAVDAAAGLGSAPR